MCLAQGHNAVTPVRLEPATPWSQVKHSATALPEIYSKTCVKQPPQIGFQDQLSLNAGQKYCRMLQVGHSAILSTFIKLPFVIKIFVLSIFEWTFYTGFTVLSILVVKIFLLSDSDC